MYIRASNNFGNLSNCTIGSITVHIGACEATVTTTAAAARVNTTNGEATTSNASKATTTTAAGGVTDFEDSFDDLLNSIDMGWM